MASDNISGDCNYARFLFPFLLLVCTTCPQGEPGSINIYTMKGQKGDPGFGGPPGLSGICGARGDPGPDGRNGYYP